MQDSSWLLLGTALLATAATVFYMRERERTAKLLAREATEAAWAAAMSSADAQRLRSILTEFYSTNAPDGIHKVEDLVARLVGGPPCEVGGVTVGGILWTEPELFAKLESKYGVKPTPPNPVSLTLAAPECS